LTSTTSNRSPRKSSTRPKVAPLDGDTTEPELLGGKAAALAIATSERVRALDGVVLTTAFCEDVDDGAAVHGHDAVAEAFDAIGGGSRPLVARSSSVVEDQGESSAAGQFESVIGIDGLEELEDAVRTVLDSREQAGAADHPIAVLIQPMVDPEVGGVLFGVDPVTGRTDRRVVTAIAGQPDPLVSGEVDGSRYVLETDGSVVEFDQRDGPELADDLLRQLVDLSDRVARIFDGPQDVEWAVVGGQLVLLQSRPVTTQVRGVPAGPVYGPGPVAETFPERLAPLEQELWIPPLEEGVTEALRLSSTASDDELQGPDLVVAVAGFAAIDLERTGEIEAREDRPPWFAVTKRIRKLRAAWRVGRLRSALPALADRLIDRVDTDLEQVPRLDQLTDRQLVALLGRGRRALRSLHAHEVMMGLLTQSSDNRLTGASVALRVLVEARTEGRSDEEIVTRSPVVLALSPPRIAPHPELPEPSNTPRLVPGRGDDALEDEDHAATDAGVVREALRLRVRWIQELTGRAAWALGERLTDQGHLRRPEQVKYLGYDELAGLVTRRIDVDFETLDERCRAFEADEPPPLPARFRISDRGMPVPYREAGGSAGGTGAGGGRSTGVVSHDADDPPNGSVLVVRTLTPGIGPMLTRLNGIVAETGSVLAHLAILARENGVATVVGYAGATDELQEGQTVTVDGDSGQVTVEDDDDQKEDGS
jgi:phosphohistidine swiveling domain-containing protein